MYTPRLRYLALVLLVALLVASALACDLGGGSSKPTITITAPTSDAQFEEGEEVNVLSSANDAKGITRVELLVDGDLYRTDSTPSVEGEKSLAMAQTWRAADPGMHTLSVIAYNVDGAGSDPWAVTIEVVEAGGVVTPPTPTTPPPPPPEATATTPPPPEATATTPPAPDLHITEIKSDPSSPVVDTPAMVGVRIHNQGATEARNFKVVWRSGESDDGLEWTVTSLAPGAYNWVQDPYTYTGHGHFTTHAIVDSDSYVDEIDEENNQFSWEIDAVRLGSQWAIGATASSEYSSPRYSAQQATGAPNTMECGDIETAWASETSTGVDWLEVSFGTAMVPAEINIRETYSPGFINKVEVKDQAGLYHIVWEGTPGAVEECPRVVSIAVSGVDVRVNAVRISLDQRNGGYWNEIDAVELVGQY